MDLIEAENLSHKILKEFEVDDNRWSLHISGSQLMHRNNSNYMGLCSKAWSEKYKYREERAIYLDVAYALINNEEWLRKVLHHEIIHSKVADFQEPFNIPESALGGDHGRVYQKFCKIYNYNYEEAEELKKTFNIPLPNWLSFCKYCNKSFYINRIDTSLIEIKCKDCKKEYGDKANLSWVRTFYYDKNNLTEEVKSIIREEAKSIIWRPQLTFTHNVHGISEGAINGEVIDSLKADGFNF